MTIKQPSKESWATLRSSLSSATVQCPVGKLENVQHFESRFQSWICGVGPRLVWNWISAPWIVTPLKSLIRRVVSLFFKCVLNGKLSPCCQDLFPTFQKQFFWKAGNGPRGGNINLFSLSWTTIQSDPHRLPGIFFNLGAPNWLLDKAKPGFRFSICLRLSNHISIQKYRVIIDYRWYMDISKVPIPYMFVLETNQPSSWHIETYHLNVCSTEVVHRYSNQFSNITA